MGIRHTSEDRWTPPPAPANSKRSGNVEQNWATRSRRSRSAWTGRPTQLAAAVDRLATEFALHVEVTEGPNGLHQAILAGDLRLANQVGALAAEHAEIAAEIAAFSIADEADDGRTRGHRLLDRIARHRQRGADLIYEAYQVDLGGGD